MVGYRSNGERFGEIAILVNCTTVLWYNLTTLSTEKGTDMCKPVYAIDTPAGRIGIFDGDESEDYHGIRIFWIDENDAVIDLIAMVEGESAKYLEERIIA